MPSNLVSELTNIEPSVLGHSSANAHTLENSLHPGCVHSKIQKLIF